jgi:glutamate-5-semialdehyde dehydrogenase
VAKAAPERRTAALGAIADAIDARHGDLLAANREDLAAAGELPEAMRDRLALDDGRLASLSRAVREVAAQPELVGRVERPETRPNGLEVARVRIPLGVIAMIYEARPNVTVDAAALCLKSGNACILRGGSEAANSNVALLRCIHAGLDAAELPRAAVQMLPARAREAIAELVALDDLIDLCIPRGGEGLIRFVAEHARVPVIKHYKGVCHVYVHASADVATALAIVDNAKTSRPSACNSCETVVVDRAIASSFIPALVARVGGRVELRGDAAARALGVARDASDADWAAEYLANILAVRVVDDLDAAIAHVERYGSSHTEAIVARDSAAADRFVRELDSSTVLINASTRFADGGELGLGAEIGISTTRLHAYGPMGAEGLTTTKFVVRGTGQIRGA